MTEGDAKTAKYKPCLVNHVIASEQQLSLSPRLFSVVPNLTIRHFTLFVYYSKWPRVWSRRNIRHWHIPPWTTSPSFCTRHVSPKFAAKTHTFSPLIFFARGDCKTSPSSLVVPPYSGLQQPPGGSIHRGSWLCFHDPICG